jgi:hypothetical protein
VEAPEAEAVGATEEAAAAVVTEEEAAAAATAEEAVVTHRRQSRQHRRRPATPDPASKATADLLHIDHRFTEFFSGLLHEELKKHTRSNLHLNV